MKRLRFSPESERDLTAIYDHIRRGGSEIHATKTIQKIMDRIEQLSRFPYLGTRCEHIANKWRSFYEGSHVIYYRDADIGIEVLRIVHGRREQRRALGQQLEGSMEEE